MVGAGARGRARRGDGARRDGEGRAGVGLDRASATPLVRVVGRAAGGAAAGGGLTISPGSPSVRRGPGLFLEHDVALDREHAAPVAEVEQLDQLRIDVQLVAVLA